MRFWDASALVSLLDAAADRGLGPLLRADGDVVVWWGSHVECESALRRQEREGKLTTAGVEEARARLRGWQESWDEVQPGDLLRETAVRLLAVHPLRTGDALQLAAALQAADVRPSRLPFVCVDRRLAEAASREGFEVLPAVVSPRG